MSDVKKYSRCGMCLGTGVYSHSDQSGKTVVQDPCETCNGSGYFEDGKVDTTDIMDELDKIHKKVKDIWDKVKTL